MGAVGESGVLNFALAAVSYHTWVETVFLHLTISSVFVVSDPGDTICRLKLHWWALFS